jgi:hypothetical protein
MVFLYRAVLEMDLDDFNAVRAGRQRRVPTVLSAAEIKLSTANSHVGGLAGFSPEK